MRLKRMEPATEAAAWFDTFSLLIKSQWLSGPYLQTCIAGQKQGHFVRLRITRLALEMVGSLDTMTAMLAFAVFQLLPREDWLSMFIRFTGNTGEDS